MRVIAGTPRRRARAFWLRVVLVIFGPVLFGHRPGNPQLDYSGCFLVGSAFSTAAGYLGMSAAIRAISPDCQRGESFGMNRALSIAFPAAASWAWPWLAWGSWAWERFYIVTGDGACLRFQPGRIRAVSPGGRRRQFKAGRRGRTWWVR